MSFPVSTGTFDAVGKRSKWMSKGWWKYQARRPKVAATKASAFLWAKGKALWLRLFPTKLSDDELFAKLAKDVKEIQNTSPTRSAAAKASVICSWG